MLRHAQAYAADQQLPELRSTGPDIVAAAEVARYRILSHMDRDPHPQAPRIRAGLAEDTDAYSWWHRGNESGAAILAYEAAR